jgi:hypothetical protein
LRRVCVSATSEAAATGGQRSNANLRPPDGGHGGSGAARLYADTAARYYILVSFLLILLFDFSRQVNFFTVM